MTVLSEASRKKLSESLKAKWASGTRKPTPRSAYKKSSATLKKMVADGRLRVPQNTSEQCRAARAKADEEKIANSLREMAKRRTGLPNPDGPSAKGEGHWHARYWELLSPDRITYRFINISEFIRTHEHLFAPEDLVWKKHQCRASKGLRQLFQTKRAPLSWKGWRPIKRLDKNEARKLDVEISVSDSPP